MKKSDIPQAVTDKAQELLNFLTTYDYPHAGELKFLGTYNDIDYYTPYYPDADIGFPTVYSYNNKGVCNVYKEYDALNIISLFYRE